MLAVINSSLWFTYMNVGAPGRCNDASVYTRSILFDVIQPETYAKHQLDVGGGTKIQTHLITDSMPCH